jgi:hypothetical protein
MKMFGSGSGIRNDKMVGSRIKHPGSATLLWCLWKILIQLLLVYEENKRLFIYRYLILLAESQPGPRPRVKFSGDAARGH